MSIRTKQVNDYIYKLTAENGSNNANVVLLTGSRYNILIDTGYPATAEELLDAVKEISGNPVKYIINTKTKSEFSYYCCFFPGFKR